MAAEQDTCTPKVFRLYMGDTPNEADIVACLRHDADRLRSAHHGAGVREVFAHLGNR